MNPRIGPRMQEALEHCPAPSMLEIAHRVGPNGSLCYGYRTVHRCLAAGLVTLDPRHPDASKRGKGAVVLTDAGRAARNGP